MSRNFEETIFHTYVTPKWLSEILLETTGNAKKHPEIHLQDFQAEAIGIGAGFLSHILKVNLKWSQNSEEIGLPEVSGFFERKIYQLCISPRE